LKLCFADFFYLISAKFLLNHPPLTGPQFTPFGTGTSLRESADNYINHAMSSSSDCIWRNRIPFHCRATHA